MVTKILDFALKKPFLLELSSSNPSITDGVHCNENLVEIIPVFFNFFKLFQKKKNIYIYISHFM